MAMAQDTYRHADRSHPDPRQSQSSWYPEPAYSSLQHSQSQKQLYREASPGQRSKMDAAQHQKTRQPINDAVNSAVDKAEGSNTLPPDVLTRITSEITANVLQQLKATNLDNPAANQTSSAAAPTSVPTNGTTIPNPVHPDNSPPQPQRNVQTPPSPHQTFDQTVLASQTSPTRSTYSSQDRYSPDHDRVSVSPTSQPTQANQPDEVRSNKTERPKPAATKSADITTVEKIWGPLFEGSRPTARLGQFLRGLALHLIEDYEPKYSLVVTPLKLQKYYEDTKLSAELYPWQTVFDDHTSSISRLYREVEAQHHLVQEKVDGRPDIPGLTPLGFEKWCTLMLLAHPEQEFERLQKAVLDMPICNFDDRKERFPKEISRRLFPKLPDQNIREKLEKAMVTHCNITLLNRWTSAPELGLQQSQPTTTGQQADSVPSRTSPQPTAPLYLKTETAPPGSVQGSTAERERQSYVNTPSEGAIEEGDDVPIPTPIERQRKPYATQPGGGRNYDDIRRPATPPEPRTAPPPPAAASASSAKLGRSASVVSHSGRPTDSPRSQPISINPGQYPSMEGFPIPEANQKPHHRANSVLNKHHQSGRAIRHRSPSANTKGGDYRRPDGDVSCAPTAYAPYGSLPSGDVIEDARRQREYERHRPPDRQEPMRSSMYEMSAREREAGPRYQSSAGYGDSSRGHYSSDEDYYRSTGGRTHNGYDGQKYYR